MALNNLIGRSAAWVDCEDMEEVTVNTNYVLWKPMIDAVLAGVLLVLTSPVLLVAMLLVRLTSRGPALYPQTRLGQGGRPFTIYKLRSMYLDCEQLTGPKWSLPRDPRVTSIGRILRSTHLDELPQLWNVLRGEMSLVGPRPERPEIIVQLERALPDYRKRLEVRPGITGLAQVHLPPDTDLQSVRRKLNYDLYYTRHLSFWLDARILISTPFYVARVSHWTIARLVWFPRHSNPIEVQRPMSTKYAWTRPTEVLDVPSPGAAQLDVPSITVVVPVRNEEAHLGRVLDLLLNQDYPKNRFEVLVIDGRSTDGTWAIAESYRARHPNLKVIDNPKRLSSAARNLGIRHARGDLILIVDGHCELDESHYFCHLADAFGRSNAHCVGRPQPLDVTRVSTLQQAIAAARSCWLGHHPSSFIYSSDEQFVPAKSVAVAYRRSIFDQVGLFDESFDACEDVEFNHRIDRAGLCCYFTPNVEVRYHPRSSLLDLFRQMVRYGRGRTRLLRKHPETFSLGGFIPAFWMAVLLSGPLVASAWPVLWMVYLGVIALYLTVVLGVSAAIARNQRTLTFLVWLPLVFLTVHAGSGWGVLNELVWRRRPIRTLGLSP